MLPGPFTGHSGSCCLHSRTGEGSAGGLLAASADEFLLVFGLRLSPLPARPAATRIR